MKVTKKQRLASLAAIVLMAGGAFTACSDWDDHYTANTQINPTAEKTIWEMLESRSDLSDFRKLVAKANMDTTLNKINAYTVWAPLDGTFNYDSVVSVSEASGSKLLKEFVLNHIAQYSHSTTSAAKERILLLNEKKEYMEGVPGKWTMAGLPIREANLACKNGYLNVIDGNIPFYPNIYESLRLGYPGMDSVSKYILKYDVRTLDLSQSTEGPTVNGERTYLDSVYIEYNSLINSMGTWINEEDSSYTMLIPDNEAWAKAKASIAKSFNYVSSFWFLDGSTADAERTKNTKQTTAIDAAYLQDSIATRMLRGYMFYNNNLYNNGALKTLETGGVLEVDSLMGGVKLFTEEAKELFSNVTRYTASNGNMFVTDSLRLQPWNAWNPLIRIEGENARVSYANAVVTEQGAREYVNAETLNPKVTGKISQNGFRTFTARANRNPKVDFYLTDIRSTEYNIYVVILPNIINDLYDTIPRQNQLQFAIGNNDAKGNMTSWGFEEYGKPFSVKNEKLGSFYGEVLANDPTKVDTLYVGTIEFPIAYHNYMGTGDFNPFLRIEDCVERWNGKVTSDLRLDCILLVPTELDNYLKEHPDYKYGDGTYTYKEERFTSSRID